MPIINDYLKILLYLTLLLPGIVSNAEFTIYTDSELSSSREKYAKNINWNFRNTIWNELNPEEKHKLRKVGIIYPLRSVRGGFMDFYSQGNTISLPINAIKIFDDLATSHAWLTYNNYTPATITDYIMLLKYVQNRDFPKRAYQKPFTALYIPKNVYANKKVDHVAQNILKSAIVWIVLHELGHIYHQHGHRPDQPLQSQQNEIQADAFATEIMRRIGVVPAGMALFYTIRVHWEVNRSDCPNPTSWTNYRRKSSHPPSALRLSELARQIARYKFAFSRKETNIKVALNAVDNLSSILLKISTELENTDLQKLIRQRAKFFGNLIDPLRPRRIGQVPALHTRQKINVLKYVCKQK